MASWSFRCGGGCHALEVHPFDTPTPHVLDDNAKTGMCHALAGARHTTEEGIDQPAHGRHILDSEVGVESLAQLVDGHAAGYPVSCVALLLNLRLLDVVFVANLADDLL